jgi:hypothetical protein
MAINQISVFVENNRGKLSAITELIANSGVDIRALSIGDSSDFGVLRMIVSDAPKAKAALEAGHHLVSITKVIAVEMPDVPGSMARVIRDASDAGVNIEYVYAFVAVSKNHAYLVIRAEDNSAAEKILLDKGYTLATEEDISKL